jgi:hypothetical protein
LAASWPTASATVGGGDAMIARSGADGSASALPTAAMPSISA